jgi:hypothetical protein
MTEITIANLSDFRARFYDFYDGLIRNITVSFMSSHDKTRVVVTCSVQDREAEQNNGWINLTININNVTELILIEDSITCVVLSSGVNILFSNDSIYLDFCPFTEEPQSIDDFKKSRFLVVGTSCFWHVSPYSE